MMKSPVSCNISIQRHYFELLQLSAPTASEWFGLCYSGNEDEHDSWSKPGETGDMCEEQAEPAADCI